MKRGVLARSPDRAPARERHRYGAAHVFLRQGGCPQRFPHGESDARASNRGPRVSVGPSRVVFNRRMSAMSHRGRLISGLGQASALWFTALLIVYLVPHAVVMWVSLCSGLVACLVLGRVHQVGSRPDSAVGSFIGAVLWPLLTGVAIIAITIVSTSLSDVE
jgi:hypothetical protein